jgi:TonB-linked SusC/RagA family outer membrane protein
MKKKRLKQKFPIRELKKLFCIMKLVFFFLLLSTNLIWAVQTYAQITSLNLDLNNVALEEVFNAIRKQSEFEFFYNNDQINTTVKVSVKAKEADIEEVLEQVLPAIYEYKIKDRYILINKRKEVTPGLSPQPQQIKKTIIGVITDQKGESIIGANIVEVGTTNGTVTDINGNFALRVEPDATIHISYIGYLSQDIYTSGRNTFKIVLEEDTKALEEVVVVGYGTQNKVTITGSISTISTAELTQSPVSNISNALAGRLPGLLSVQRSGQPGADQSTIRIRGVSSFSGTQDPLVIVDGIEGVNYNVIDPNEIESVSILKDASATAVYGVRGANGVMIITTKRGQSGAPKVSYSYEYAVQEFSDVRHSMNAMDYATHYNLAQSYDGYITGAYNPHFSNEAIEKFRTHEDPVFYPDVDWFAYMFDKTSGQQRHNFNINGGTDKIKYFVSLGYFTQDGLIKHTKTITDYDAGIKFERYNIRSNFDFNITDRLSLNADISTQIEDRSGTNTPVTRLFEQVWRSNPMDAPKLEDTDGRYVVLDTKMDPGNPIDYLISYGYKRDYSNYLNASVRLNYKLDQITKGLSIRGLISYNNYYQQAQYYSKNKESYSAIRLNDGTINYIPITEPSPYGFSESMGKNRKIYFETALDYNRKFGLHNVAGLVLYNQSKYHSPSLAYLIPNGYQGLVGRITYDYANRYMLDVNFGYNGTENFAEGKRFGFFPAISLGWAVSEESFFPENNFLTFLKLRASYGEVGNDRVGGARFLYRPSSWVYVNNDYRFGMGADVQGHRGAKEAALGNPDLTWERAKKTNIGVDAAFLQDRIKVTIDYFTEKRDNILTTFNTIPFVVGAQLPPYNFGKMNNEGWDGEISYNNKVNLFNYWIKGNLTYARNTIIEMDEITRLYPYLMRTGQSYGQMYGLRDNGIYNSWEEVNKANRPLYQMQNDKIQPGDIKYYDINGDGVIDGDDQIPIGYSNFPEVIFGTSIGGNFKGFDFSILFQGASNVSHRYHRREIRGFEEGSNAPDYMIASWTHERYQQGLPINFPRYNLGITYANANHQSSTFNTVDASYVRLKNIEFGYTLSGKILKNIGLNSIRIYINGDNLHTWDSLLPGTDPESTGAGLSENDRPYPVTRRLNFGLNVKF